MINVYLFTRYGIAIIDMFDFIVVDRAHEKLLYNQSSLPGNLDLICSIYKYISLLLNLSIQTLLKTNSPCGVIVSNSLDHHESNSKPRVDLL